MKKNLPRTTSKRVPVRAGAIRLARAWPPLPHPRQSRSRARNCRHAWRSGDGGCMLLDRPRFHRDGRVATGVVPVSPP